MGATFAPVLLRLVLAVTFIWAGLGKLMARMPVDEQQIAALASMGIIVEGQFAAKPAAPGAQPEVAPAETAPADAAPAGPTEPLPPPSRPAHSPVAPTPAERAVRPGGGQPQTPPPETPPPAAPASEPAQPTDSPAPGAGASGDATGKPAAVAPAASTPAAPMVRRVWGLALRIHSAAHPGVDEAGMPRMKLWPASIGSGNWPRYFAIAVVMAELGGGVLVGLGLLTRLGAASLAGVMLGAIWLDQIGPAMQAGNTVLWLLPAHEAWDIAAWRPLLWQFALLCCAGAVVLLGAGAPSLDRALGWFGGRGDDDDL